MRIAVVVGVRPQFVKARALQEAFEASSVDGEVVTYVSTGQHYSPELSVLVERELGLKIDHRLNDLPYRTRSSTAVLGCMIDQLTDYFASNRDFGIVMVIGDANTTLAAAICASRAGIPVGHIEAGVRSPGASSTPEMVNAILVTQLARLHLAPTLEATACLDSERAPGVTRFTGDVALDLVAAWRRRNPIGRPRSGILASLHHAASDQDRLESSIAALGATGARVQLLRHPSLDKPLARLELPKNIAMLEPTGFYGSLAHIDASAAVVGDSGGLQRESYYLRVPFLTLNRPSFWPSLVSLGATRELVGSTSELAASIAAAQSRYPVDVGDTSHFGTEGSAARAVNAIREFVQAGS